ncbi:hypothetical protein BC828DRAFT_180864 [Blastocladiella britannica]|nr:hypothetical protein BC828DRAFT_180864 [Blastocladiella britannica]
MLGLVRWPLHPPDRQREAEADKRSICGRGTSGGATGPRWFHLVCLRRPWLHSWSRAPSCSTPTRRWWLWPRTRYRQLQPRTFRLKHGSVTLIWMPGWVGYQLGSAESPFFKEQVEVFVNGNQFIFPAGLPGSQLDTTFSFTAGQSTEYPFDVHSTPIAIYAMTTASRTQLVQQMGGQPLRASPMLPITINLVGSLQSLVSDSSIDERLAAIGMINVQVFVSRSSLAKLYAVAMTVLMWMVAGSMALAVWNVMKYQREAAYYGMVLFTFQGRCCKTYPKNTLSYGGQCGHVDGPSGTAPGTARDRISGNLDRRVWLLLVRFFISWANLSLTGQKK